MKEKLRGSTQIMAIFIICTVLLFSGFSSLKDVGKIPGAVKMMIMGNKDYPVTKLLSKEYVFIRDFCSGNGTRGSIIYDTKPKIEGINIIVKGEDPTNLRWLLSELADNKKITVLELKNKISLYTSKNKLLARGDIEARLMDILSAVPAKYTGVKNGELAEIFINSRKDIVLTQYGNAEYGVGSFMVLQKQGDGSYKIRYICDLR